jgi:hypothetical protein
MSVLDKFLDPKFAIALVVLGMFGWALSVDPDDATMKGALIAGFAGAWGYYLGSSNSSNQVREQMGKVIDLATANAPEPTKPDIELQPGESATVGAKPEGEM